MGSWRRMGAFLGLVAQERDPRDDYEYEDFGYESDYGADSRRFGESAAEDAPAPLTIGALAMQPVEHERQQGESNGSSRPLTVKLTGFGQAREIGERYRDGSSVILDMTALTDAEARRVVDFAAGLAFAMHGTIDKVTARVFMLLPPQSGASSDSRRSALEGIRRRSS